MTDILETQRGWRVTCPTHSLDRTVDTEQHARNLAALHQRRDHDDPTDNVAVDLTAAAAAVVSEWDHGYVMTSQGAMQVWRALTGINDMDDAIDYARQIAAADPPITAHVPPF